MRENESFWFQLVFRVFWAESPVLGPESPVFKLELFSSSVTLLWTLFGDWPETGPETPSVSGWSGVSGISGRSLRFSLACNG